MNVVLWQEWIEPDRRGAPSPDHVCVTRRLRSWQSDIAKFTAHLTAAAEGLAPAWFADFDDDESPGVTGWRLRTGEEQTIEAEYAEREKQRDLKELARLKQKYEDGAS